MQSSGKSTFEVFARRGRRWPAVFFCGSILFLLIASPAFLAAQSSPRHDSSQVFLRVSPADVDSSFRLRAFFSSGNKFPRYLYWRSQTVRKFEKMERESGDFVSLPADTTLVWEGSFRLEKNDLRSVNFYVIDNDLIVGSAEIRFDTLKLTFPKTEVAVAQTNSPAGASPEKSNETPPGLPIPTAPKPELKLAKDDFEIDGIVSTDVRTGFGRQFLANFQEAWQPPEKIGGYWISIKEILTPGRYTLLAVSLNNRELFRQYLTPNADFLKQLAAETAELLVQKLKSGDPDGGFSDEDLHGIGVEN